MVLAGEYALTRLGPDVGKTDVVSCGVLGWKELISLCDVVALSIDSGIVYGGVFPPSF